jgi:hypothetical protein
MRRLLLVACVLVLFGAARWYVQRPIQHAAGALTQDEPQQRAPASAAPIHHGDYELTPRADFMIEARVLSRMDYTFDAGAALAPVDFALGWGRMSDTSVIEQLDIGQSARFYHYRWSDQPPIPAPEIVRSSANMHLIPADDAVARALDRVRVGNVVRLQGRLVDARRADGWHWNTSLTREDSGGGACELVLVDAVTRL